VTVDWAQAAAIISAMAVFTGLQAFWIARALDRVFTALDRIDAKLGDDAERIARLEAAHGH